MEDDDLFEHHRLRADPRQSPVRLDRFLSDRLANTSRNKIQDAIGQAYVKVNGAGVKSNYKVKPGDEVVVMLPQPPRDNEVVPEDLPIDIRYEDDDLLVIHKQAGLVVHPAYQNWSGTLVNALAYHFQHLPSTRHGEGRPGLVHRIDKDTSGLMVVAKSETAMTHLARQFFDHTIERTYWALVWGEPEPARGTIDVNLGRSPKDRRVTEAFPAGDVGRHAVTHYETLRPMRYVSLVRCNLETGRTHQIRAHMRYLGHPLFNDATYGGDKILKGTVFSKYRSFVDNCFRLLPRQALHAKSLGFTHPRTREWLQFDSDLPDDFAAALDKWERYVQYE
ncbi:MAG: RluA family pseudouridine synthase [Catalinimonas sp.]